MIEPVSVRIATVAMMPANEAAYPRFATAIEDLLGTPPTREDMFALAGPNDTVQVLLDAAGWVALAKIIALIYGVEFVKEAAKATWKGPLPKFAEGVVGAGKRFTALLSAANDAVRDGLGVYFGYPMNVSGGRRHVTMPLDSLTPGAVATAIARLAQLGPQIERRLAEADIPSGALVSENEDCSTRLFIDADGVAYIEVRSGYREPARRLELGRLDP